MKYKQNLHTHTRYDDGKNSPEELILQALKIGFDSIGFSGHSYMDWVENISMTQSGTEAYKREITELRKKYKGVMDVYCGLEWEMYSNVDLRDYDYVIGSSHYFLLDGEYVGFDRSASVVKRVMDEHFQGDGMRYAQTYYENLSTLATRGRVDIVGHLDLICKHAEKENFFDTESKTYQGYALDAVRELMKKVEVFEVNTGAIARGYRTTPYPAPFLLKEIKRLHGNVVLSSDCHDKEYLDHGFSDALAYIKTCGFDEVLSLTADGFKGEKIK